MSEIFVALIGLAEALGVNRINALPGAWEHQIDERWAVAVNGHAQECKTKRGDAVPAFSAVFWRNGWPAGVVTPNSGIVAGGTEDELIDALNAAIDNTKPS